MKKALLFLFAIVLCGAVKAQSLSVYIFDNDGPYTNVRNRPSGTVVDRIPVDANAMLEVKTPTNGWWRVEGDCYDGILRDDFEEVKLKGSSTGYWVHYSCLGVGTRNYGGERLYLRSDPSKGARVVYTIKEETVVRPVEIRGDWVKVKTLDGRGFGWIQSEWLCGNSVTNCC